MNVNDEDFEGFGDYLAKDAKEEDEIPFGDDDDEPIEKSKEDASEENHQSKPTHEEKPIDFDELYKELMIRIGERLKIIYNITYQDRIKILAVEILNDLELLNKLIKAKLGGE